MRNKFLLIDGNLLMFQSFYASYNNKSAILQNSKGIYTNGIVLFFYTLTRALQELKPSHLLIAFDHKDGCTWRKQEFSGYKAGRSLAPEIIFPQFVILKNLLTKLKINWLEHPNDEADDIIGTLASIEEPNLEKIIFSKDKDLLQLVNNSSYVYKYDSFRHVYDTINIHNFKDIFDLEPCQIPDFKGLAGDNSDNLKGVLGIGDKTAKNLLKEYKTLEKIYENLSSLKPSIQKKLIENKEEAFLCKRLATLNKNVNISKDLSDYTYFFDLDNAIEELQELELFSVINKFKGLK